MVDLVPRPYAGSRGVGFLGGEHTTRSLMPSHPSEPTFVASSGEEQIHTNSADAEIVEFSKYRRSRYERNSRSLPHLGDDPDWTPSTFEQLTPISDDGPQRWFDRFRR